jgi:hypothetical protein
MSDGQCGVSRSCASGSDNGPYQPASLIDSRKRLPVPDSSPDPPISHHQTKQHMLAETMLLVLPDPL